MSVTKVDHVGYIRYDGTSVTKVLPLVVHQNKKLSLRDTRTDQNVGYKS